MGVFPTCFNYKEDLFMWISDIIKALHLLNGADERDFCIEKIENHFIYLTSGRRIAFYEIEDFLEEENGE